MIELTLDEVRALLSRAVDRAGSQRAFGTQAGVSACYVNDVLKGRRTPGRRMLDALALDKIERFVSRERS